MDQVYQTRRLPISRIPNIPYRAVGFRSHAEEDRGDAGERYGWIHCPGLERVNTLLQDICDRWDICQRQRIRSQAVNQD